MLKALNLIRILLVLIFSGCATSEIKTPEIVVKETTIATPEKREEKPQVAVPGVRPKKLLLALDGISFDHFKKMQEGGYFRSFKPVAPMVATFPSISDPNWAKIMRTPLEVSFTKEHFDQNLKDGKGEVT